jgi:ubiquinone/menaquinone biosynthesis C-methylase UbiE
VKETTDLEHANEYHDAMLDTCQLLWGEGFLAPGGPGNVARMVGGLDLKDRLVVDVGCGLGGPACVLAEQFGARVLGLDLERPLIERARERAAQRGLADRVRFEVVGPGALPCEDASVDLVISAGAFTQTADKRAAFRDCYRVLKIGGAISLYDWVRAEAGELSGDMQRWIELEGLTYQLETLERYGELLEEVGFREVALEDASTWYRRQVAVEHAALRGPLFGRMCELMGREQTEHFIENWRAMRVVCETGEMRQGYTRGVKS